MTKLLNWARGSLLMQPRQVVSRPAAHARGSLPSLVKGISEPPAFAGVGSSILAIERTPPGRDGKNCGVLAGSKVAHPTEKFPLSKLLLSAPMPNRTLGKASSSRQPSTSCVF
jgi:hypothetical protein